MSNFTFAFITPSYAPDFQRCKLLCWSIKQFVSHPVKHYIVVENKDLNLFQQLADANTIILTKENILPKWIKRIPFFDRKNIWINFKGYKSGNWLLKGWLIQQIVKLAAAQYVEEEVLIFVDSDVAFIEAFDVYSLINQDKVRLFRVEHSTDKDSDRGRKWKEIAKQLLKLPQENNYYDYYVSQVVTWRRSNLVQMYENIEANFNQNWLEVVAGAKDLSEYVLYGIFVSYVINGKGHYDNHLQPICFCYWKDEAMSHEELKEFFHQARSSGNKAVMISAKSPIELSIQQLQNYLTLT